MTEYRAGMEELIVKGDITREQEQYFRVWINDAYSIDGKDNKKISYDDLYEKIVILEEAGEIK